MWHLAKNVMANDKKHGPGRFKVTKTFVDHLSLLDRGARARDKTEFNQFMWQMFQAVGSECESP